MSGSASLTVERGVLGHTLGFAAMPFPAQVFVALCAMAPVPSATIAGAEVSGGGYTRMPAGFALLDTPSSIAANNTTSVEFPTATADWGTIGYFELWDAPSNGNRLYWGTLLNPSDGTAMTISVMTSDIVRFSPGMLGVEVGSSSGGTAGIGAFLPLEGGTLTGPLMLAGNAVSPLQAVPLQQLNTALSSGSFLPLAGGTMSGPFTSAKAGVMHPGTVIEPYQNPNAWALGTPNDAGGMGGSMTIRGQPYGYYDTGTLLSLVSTTLPLTSSRAGINGGFENGISAIAGYGGFDLVTLYSSAQASPPPLVLHNVTYDASHVIPHPPLTPTQMAVLRKNMWVLTNSVDTTVSTTPAVPNGYKPENRYGSYVTDWAADGTSITVVGWTVPGSGHTAVGQVPPVGTLEPGAANAAAYFGAPTGVFAGNFVLIADPVSQPDSRIKTLQGLEIDFFSYSITNYQIAVQGLSMACSSFNGAKLTADSYGIKLSSFPTSIIVNYTDLGLSIDAGIAIQSNVFNANHWWSPPPWAGTPTTNLTWESQNYIDSDLLQLQCWVSRDTAAGGWASASLHLGMRVDGTPLSLSGGTRMAQIVWNPQGHSGGIQLQTPAGGAILSTDGAGWLYPQVGNAANDAAAATLGVPIGAMYRNGSVLQVRVT